MAGSEWERLAREDEPGFEGEHGMVCEDCVRTMLGPRDRGRWKRAERIFVMELSFMKLSSTWVIEFSVPVTGRMPVFALVGLPDGIRLGRNCAQDFRASTRNSGFWELVRCCAHAMAKSAPVARAQRAIQLDRGVTSDQERTEEILERTRMALPERDCWLEHHAADEATGAVV